MAKDITIEGFELSITARVLCDRLVDRRTHYYRSSFSHDELLTQGIYAANYLLKELGLSGRAWTRKRGKKAFIFCECTRKILAELAISADKSAFGLRRPRFVLLGRRGFMTEKSIAALLMRAETQARLTKGVKR